MDKGVMPSVALLLLAVTAICAGCSIKEDRSLCPCSLTIDFSDVEESAVEMSEMYIGSADGFLYYDPEVSRSMADEEVDGVLRKVYNVKVPKTMVHILVASGAEGHFSAGAGVQIPLGEQCPPVYMHYSVLDAMAERSRETVRLHKDYCRIGIQMLASEGEYPFTLTVRGNISGIGADRSVVQGDFLYSFVPGSDGYGAVRVPRQQDSGLVLLVVDEDRILREFALGEYIAESGYDWSQEDLDDIEVAIDYANSYISIDVEGWSGSFEFDIVI